MDKLLNLKPQKPRDKCHVIFNLSYSTFSLPQKPNKELEMRNVIYKFLLWVLQCKASSFLKNLLFFCFLCSISLYSDVYFPCLWQKKVVNYIRVSSLWWFYCSEEVKMPLAEELRRDPIKRHHSAKTSFLCLFFLLLEGEHSLKYVMYYKFSWNNKSDTIARVASEILETK